VSPLPPVGIVITIEVPRWSFVKRGSSGRVNFISPLPCPYNYGAAESFIGLEGDLLDAIVLGRRRPFGAKVRTQAWGAVTLTDRGMSDDKLICSEHPVSSGERARILRFFAFYARCKGVLNTWRRRPGRNACDGWCDAQSAIARATPRTPAWTGTTVRF